MSKPLNNILHLNFPKVRMLFLIYKPFSNVESDIFWKILLYECLYGVLGMNILSVNKPTNFVKLIQVQQYQSFLAVKLYSTLMK